MRFTDEAGKVWEWRGETRSPQVNEWFMSNDKTISQTKSCTHWIAAIVHPAPTIHEFGGVKFEETGETRAPKAGEWYLFANVPVAVVYDATCERLILRPHKTT